jgi:predicted nucleic acid-binding protein
VILVDSSIWIDHLRRGNASLARLLGDNAVLAHPWVTGELALGNLNRRDEVIGLLRGLPQATLADNDEVLRLIEQETLYGAGIGYVDAQLLAASRLTPDTRLWTKDKRLSAITARLGLGFLPTPHPEQRPPVTLSAT